MNKDCLMITKRDGSTEEFDFKKIFNAIKKAYIATYNIDAFTFDNYKEIENVINYIDKNYHSKLTSVEDIQDAVEKSLMECGYHDIAKSYILYRKKRENIRNAKSDLNKVFNQILASDKSDDNLRENANINASTPMGLMLMFGSEFEKHYVKRNLISEKYVQMHDEGYIHIHDLNFYACTFNCCHIDLETLLKNGFDTGHGFIRQPKSIQSAASLAAIIIQSNQNDMFGGQGIPMFEYNLAPYVSKSFGKRLKECIELALGVNITDTSIESYVDYVYNEYGSALDNLDKIKSYISELVKEKSDFVLEKAISLTDRDTYQAMEGFIHNMNSLHSRAGSQTPFSSINYGTGTSSECRMIIKNILKATDAGLGHHETPIFPIQIFKTKEGINTNPGDPNYDLYEYSCSITAKRYYPNYVNIDVPFNLQYYRKGYPETEMATMGCRTRVIGQLGTSEGSVKNRGNIAFTTINLPRIALETRDVYKFYAKFNEIIDDCINELLERVNFLCKKKVYNFPFLMGQNLYMGSEELEWNDNIEKALKNGTLSVGFCGLAECLIALTGAHHGEDNISYKLGINIIKNLRTKTDEATKKYGWNFSTFATPAESTAGKFLRSDRKKFGIIKGITDRDYYTNSFHIPVWFEIPAFMKMKLEGPFHELCNAGAITYIELDGDTSNSGPIVKKLVDYSRKCGISYFSINTIHDRCPICGYDGIINTNKCPNCGWIEGTEVEVKL